MATDDTGMSDLVRLGQIWYFFRYFFFLTGLRQIVLVKPTRHTLTAWMSELSELTYIALDCPEMGQIRDFFTSDFSTFRPVSQTLAFHGRASDTMGTVGVTRPSPLEKGSKFQSRVSQPGNGVTGGIYRSLFSPGDGIAEKKNL